MPNSIFQEIDSLRADLERMEKSAKFGWLTKEKMRLNRLANQFAQYISIRGGFSNDVEREYAHKLLEILNCLDTESTKVVTDLTMDALNAQIEGMKP